MTTVNNFVDILRIIREQPEWADALRSALLSKDVLELPQRLAEFADTTNKRFAALEADVAEVKVDVSDLKSGQARLESDVDQLKSGQARLESDVDQLKSGLNRLEGQVGNLRGNAYEQKVASNIGTFVRHTLNLRRVRLLKGYGATDPGIFHELMDTAEDQGVISEQERVDAGSADMVLQGQVLPDSAGAYAALEVSVTVADSDIDRALERADILQRATGEQALAAVVGADADQVRQQFARERNVTLIIVPE